ncbi:hypothetical protein HBH98_123520 [Parastagonospora nodorum]|nr:hypothetical protein HBH98_123520 [Parastagonospora nodorum]KAH4905499.1 hypothetical protein HBI80_090350 [Parastagonospora nodorum]KAH6124255.1 hypothetical protein HBI64_147370 [Parastagonospora nodorum]
MLRADAEKLIQTTAHCLANAKQHLMTPPIEDESTSISVFTSHNTKRAPTLRKHTSQILHDGIRPLIRRKMSALVMFRFKDNRTQSVISQLRHQNNFLIKPTHTKRDIAPHRRRSEDRRIVVFHASLNVRGRSQPSAQEIVDRYPCEDFVVCPGIVIGLRVHFLVDTGEPASSFFRERRRFDASEELWTAASLGSFGRRLFGCQEPA